MSSEYNHTRGVQVSVVMPVYNAEAYLRESLPDILRQTLKNIEVICVDDGSTDASAEIIRKFMKKDKRVQLIKQENMSAGAARNRGLERAQGKYVIFWDADDRFQKDALEKLYQKSEEMAADICICAARKFDANGDLEETDAYLKKSMLPEKNPFSKYDVPEYIFNFATNVPWNKMYRRGFVEENGLRYQHVKQANDTFFTLKALYCADRITYVDEELIRYRVNNENSLTGRASQMRLCIYEAYKYTLLDLKGLPDFGMVKDSFRNKALSNFYYALNIQTDFAAYKELYLTLQREGVALFELDQMEPEQFYQEWQLRDLERLMALTAEDFLLLKAYERMVDNDKIRQERSKYRELYRKERSGGITYKMWRTLQAVYRHTFRPIVEKKR